MEWVKGAKSEYNLHIVRRTISCSQLPVGSPSPSNNCVSTGLPGRLERSALRCGLRQAAEEGTGRERLHGHSDCRARCRSGAFDSFSFSIPVLGPDRQRLVKPGADICSAMLADAELNASVGVIGLHYPGDFYPKAVYSDCHKTGKPVWASEESSSHDDVNGAACWARVTTAHWVINGFTSSIMWNMIGSYFYGTAFCKTICAGLLSRFACRASLTCNAQMPRR